MGQFVDEHRSPHEVHHWCHTTGPQRPPRPRIVVPTQPECLGAASHQPRGGDGHAGDHRRDRCEAHQHTHQQRGIGDQGRQQSVAVDQQEDVAKDVGGRGESEDRSGCQQRGLYRPLRDPPGRTGFGRRSGRDRVDQTPAGNGAVSGGRAEWAAPPARRWRWSGSDRDPPEAGRQAGGVALRRLRVGGWAGSRHRRRRTQRGE